MSTGMDKKKLTRRIIGVLIGVIFMGFGISWLVPCGFGTDGYSALNLAVSGRIGWTFGTWQATLNAVMLIFVLLFDKKLIGLGTLANMILVGYSCDFFTWIWNMVLPVDFFAPLWVRIAVAIPALLIFVVAAALYMDMGLGTSPYDALPFILHKHLSKFSFRTVRIGYDLAFIVVGYLFGAPFAVVTIMMAFLLGPAIEWVGEKIKPLL